MAVGIIWTITIIATSYCAVILVHTLTWRWRFNKAAKQRQAYEVKLTKEKELL